MTRVRTMWLAIAALVVLGLAGAAAAETDVFGLKVDGEVELGGRFYLDRPSKPERAKLEEYRDLSETPFGAFRFRLLRPDERYGVEMGGSNIGQEDQEFFLASGRLGLWDFGFDWTQTPHFLFSTARLLATEPRPGVFVLPDPRPPLSAYNTARRLDEVGMRWDTAHFSIAVTPTPSLDLAAEYTRIKKDGERPAGVAFSSPGGNFYEVLRPIDETIHDMRLRAALSGEDWQVQAGYTLSLFQSGLNALTVDNPCFRLPAPNTAGGCGSDANGAQASGRVSLAPENVAHTVTVGGGVNLPWWRTRINGAASYSLRLQDDAFLPHTNNAAIAGHPSLVLPRSSLDGQVQTLLFNLGVTSRPLPPLTLSLKYRFFDLDDQTKQIVVHGDVLDDRAPVNPEERRAGRPAYTKQNLDLDARWRFGPPLALTAGGGWERWDRNEIREVPTSDEYFGKLAVDVTPLDWLVGRLSYKPSFRRISRYDTYAALNHALLEESPAAQAVSQSVLLRKYDEGERDRHRIDAMLQVAATEALALTGTASYRTDDYLHSSLGLKTAEEWSGGLDVGWSPIEWLAVYGGYVYESIDQKQRSRNREVTVVGGAQVVFDPPNFDWVSTNADTVHTLHAGVRTALIPKVLDLVLDLSYAKARGEVKTSNPLPVNVGTASQRNNATAKPFPAFEDSLLRIEAKVRYSFWKAWTASLGYVFEKFDQNNFQTDGVNPFIPGISAVWLGNDLRDYSAHIVALTLAYRFQ